MFFAPQNYICSPISFHFLDLCSPEMNDVPHNSLEGLSMYFEKTCFALLTKDNGQWLLQTLWNVEKARNIGNILKAFTTVRKHVIPSQNT